MSFARQYGRMSVSTPRTSMEYGGWSEVIGAIACALLSCATLKLDTPIQRTFPSRCKSAIAPQAFFDVFVRFRPVDLVQVDDITLKAAEAVLAFLLDGIRFQDLLNLTFFVPPALTFREDVDRVGNPLDRFRNDFFRVTQPINRGCVIQFMPAEIPARISPIDSVSSCGPQPKAQPPPSDRPGADTEARDQQIAVSSVRFSMVLALLYSDLPGKVFF